jgi:2-(1,2-epoxy-1,2-dihydrophenyl)acetyl-CoA isomerase
MSVEYPCIARLRVEQVGKILRLTINRPEKRNSLDDHMVDTMIRAVDLAGRDDEVRVILLRAVGDDFCSGFDIIGRNATPSARRPRVGSVQRRVSSQAHRLISLLASVQTPVVCEVRGWAAGLGLHMALAADFAIAAEDACMWEPYTERGLSPDSGGAWLLPRRIGVVRSREMLLLGRRVSGREAAEWGLVHSAVPQAELASCVDALVAGLADGPTVALGLTKWLLHTASSVPLEEHLSHEAFAMELAARSEDFREGLGALREKRAPEFGGR